MRDRVCRVFHALHPALVGVCLLVLLSGCPARQVTSHGSPIDDPFVHHAVQALHTTELAAAGVLDVITAGVQAGSIPRDIGVQAQATAGQLALGVGLAHDTLVRYMAGVATQDEARAAIDALHQLLIQLLALVEDAP